MKYVYVIDSMNGSICDSYAEERFQCIISTLEEAKRFGDELYKKLSEEDDARDLDTPGVWDDLFCGLLIKEFVVYEPGDTPITKGVPYNQLMPRRQWRKETEIPDWEEDNMNED